MTRRAEKRQREFERNLYAGFAALPYRHNLGTCPGCDRFTTSLAGATPDELTCFECYVTTPAARRWAKRKGNA